MTQGMITIISKETREVLAKIIVGNDGYLAPQVAKAIRAEKVKPDNLERLYRLAADLKFGCGQCLVVIGKKGVRFHGDEKLNRRYRKTFDNPNFNPRWKSGDCEYLEILESPYV